MRASGRRNLATFFVLFAVVAGMGGLAYASVPLYRLFCQVTGYGGTTQVAEGALAPDAVLDRVITVRFDSNVNGQLPWAFEPSQRALALRVGEEALAFYRVRSEADVETAGQATFNVTPAKAGLYFVKVDCFCFDEQVLAPGQEAEMPVSFYIDPAIAEDRNLDDVKTITLSYTLFQAERDSAPEDDTPRVGGLTGEDGERGPIHGAESTQVEDTIVARH
jgi:cytochrome c oxidase assembly protein subunit 11